jgi:ATP phosphoribosyltransferase regulatory subunit HisZ
LAALSPDGPQGDGEIQKDIQVVLGFAGALDRLLFSGSPGEVAALAAAVARRERGAVRQVCPKLLAIVETGLPERPEDLGPEAAEHLIGLLTLRDELAGLFPAAHLSVDLAEFAHHSLDPRLPAEAGERSYYDGLVFRAFAGPSAVPVGGGGRYDSLFRRLGAEVPAVGFSVSLERLIESRANRAGEERP